MYLKSLTSKILRSKFSTLIVNDPNKKSSDIYSLFTAASLLKEKFDILHIGKSVEDLKKNYQNSAKNPEVQKIFLAEHQNFNEFDYETSSQFIEQFLTKHSYKNVLMGNSTISKELLPRLSGKFKTQAITDVISIDSPNTFKRPIYAGNAISIISSNQPLKFIGIRLTNFLKAENNDNLENEAKIQVLDTKSFLPVDFKPKIEILETRIQKSERPELSKANVVIAGGRALKSVENFDLLYKLSEKFKNSAIGASRAAVDAGYISNDLQIGQTGQIVAPELYIAVGISGAIQHVAGMKDSKLIVAINNNADAPIFQISNYGLVGDLFKIIPELIEKL